MYCLCAGVFVEYGKPWGAGVTLVGWGSHLWAGDHTFGLGATLVGWFENVSMCECELAEPCPPLLLFVPPLPGELALHAHSCLQVAPAIFPDRDFGGPSHV